MSAAPTHKLEYITFNCHEHVVSNMVFKKRVAVMRMKSKLL